MGIGSIAAYGKAWLAADAKEKNRILELMKEAAGMTLTATQTAGLRQGMRLAEAGEERTRQLFPTVEDQAKTTLASTQKALETQTRTEAEIQETRGRERQEFDEETVATIMRFAEAAKALFGTEMIEEQMDQGVPKAVAGQAVSEAQAAGTAADLARAADRDKLGAQTYIDTRRADVEADRQRRAEAIAGRETAEQFVEQRGPEITTRAGIQQAETATAQGRLQATITTAMEGMDFAEIAATAKRDVEALKGPTAQAELDKLLAEIRTAGLPKNRAPTILDYLQKFSTPEEFRDMIIKQYREKIGELIPMEELLSRIQTLEAKKASLELGQQNNQDPNLMVALLTKNDPDFAKDLIAMGFTMGQDVDYTRIFSGMNGLIATYKGMLKDPVRGWGRDYDVMQRQGKRLKQYTEDDITEIIGLIQSGVNQGGALGNFATEYGIGITPAKRADVIHGITGIMNNKNIPPALWVRALEQLRDDVEVRPGFPGRQGLISRWDQQSYNAARAILAAAQWHFEYGIPTPQQPVPGAPQ
jgi:hypothetical protein